jgi:glutaconyl-CoA/methylmalonyl-CoA decarboxylase subunit delta
MTFQTVIDIFAVIGVGTCVWWAAVYLGRALGGIERSEIAGQEAKTAAEHGSLSPSEAGEPTEGVPADHVVAIAAAVAACGYKVVHISDSANGSAWASGGRWIHQTSHRRH